MKKIVLVLTCGLGLVFQTAAHSASLPSTIFTKALLESPVAQKPDPGSQHGGRIESNYDGFNHETVVALRKMRVTCARMDGNFKKEVCVNVAASLHCPGIQLDYVRYATLQLLFETEDWDQRHPLDQRNLTVVADGETMRLGRMELVSQSVDTRMTEMLQVTIPYPIFKKIALAQVVEVQVGKTNFEFREKNIAAFRDLNNRVKF
jgi:hypothetical protein